MTDNLPTQTATETATPTPAPTPAESGEATPTATDTAAVIAEGRRRIDDLDARIIGLVRERMSVSAEVQRARMGSGGRRVHLAREMEILHGYGDALGRPGTALAMTLLELSRGRV